MSYANFIPSVWETGINRELERKCVFLEDCHREYEGKVKNAGESVTITGIGKPTIKRLTKKDLKANGGKIDEAEEVEDTSIIMEINQLALFNYKVQDIDKAQATGNILGALQDETAGGLANEVDKYIASLAKRPEAIKLFATAKQLVVGVATANEIDIFDALDEAETRLYENDVPDSVKITAIVPPRAYKYLKKAVIQNDTNNSKLIKNGKVYEYGKMTIKMSNNVAKEADGTHLILIKTQKAIAFAKPLTHSEPYRPELGFEDAVKGFILFDAKITRPKELFVMNVKC